MTVAELLSKIDSRELSEWQAFWCVEPFGDEWRQTGTVAAMQGNAGGGKKGGGQFAPDDFIPLTRPPQDPSEMEAHFLAQARAHNAIKKRK